MSPQPIVKKHRLYKRKKKPDGREAVHEMMDNPQQTHIDQTNQTESPTKEQIITIKEKKIEAKPRKPKPKETSAKAASTRSGRNTNHEKPE